MCGTKATHGQARFCSRCGASLRPAVEAASEVPIVEPQYAPNDGKTSWHQPDPQVRIDENPFESGANEHTEEPNEERTPLTKTSIAHDVIVGVELLPNEKILRVTPCKIKGITQVKDCLLYSTTERLICISTPKAVTEVIAKLAKKQVSNVELIAPIQNVTRADVSGSKIKITFLEFNKPKSLEYVIGLLPSDLGDFIMSIRQRSFSQNANYPIVDTYQSEQDVKSHLHRGFEITGKVMKTSAEYGVQLYKLAQESESYFDEAGEEEDRYGWGRYRKTTKGRKAEQMVRRIFESVGYIVNSNIHLQEREIDLVVQRGTKKFMVECKFGRKAIDTAQLDSYIMLYYDAKRALGVNGLLFVCPTAGMTEYAKGNVLVKYRNEHIKFLDTRRWIEELKKL
jgi:hypothetical protein